MVTVMTAVHSVPIKKLQGGDPIWEKMRAETERAASQEPVLVSFLHATILHHDELECALSFHLANQLDSPTVPAMMLREIMLAAFSSDATLRSAIRNDLQAVLDRDSACQEYHLPFLYFKGFQALQTHRVAHWLWQENRHSLALFLQSQVSQKVWHRHSSRCALWSRHYARPRHWLSDW